MWQVIQKRFLFTRKATPPIWVKTAAEAVADIKPKSRIYSHSASATPVALLRALADRADSLESIEINQLHTNSDNPCLERPDVFHLNCFFLGANVRKAVELGHASLIPCFLSEIPKLIRSGRKKPDVALLHVSPPDRHGYVSLGVEVCAAYAAAETATTLIAQINEHMPRTHGQSLVHINCFDKVFECHAPLVQVPNAPLSDVESKIGKHIPALVPNGATLQMGIGGIPNAVLASLTNHKNIGIHTEMFSDGVIDLVHSGVLTNSEKKFMKGRTVTAFAMGTKELYDHVHDNPEVLFLDCAITNDPRIIGTNPKVTAINAAVEVDLTGQVCADSIGTRLISGVGGQVDFERGAALSEGGLPIICLPSTLSLKEGKTASRIVPLLKPGAGVVTTRNHVHWVVTEYGAVNLYGLNVVERARALIGISHPAHREALSKAAFERFKVTI